jgi:cytochrome c556
MKKLLVTGAIIISSIFSVGAVAQLSDEDAAAAVKRRQSVFQLLAFSNGPLGEMARGGEYNAEAAILAAERVAMLAPMIPVVFAMADTRSSSGLTTRASDTIWDNQADLAQLAMDLEAGANAALEILQSQGAAGVRQAVGQIGPKCGACHDRFRLD